jgi:hypothetical protein
LIFQKPLMKAQERGRREERSVIGWMGGPEGAVNLGRAY